MNITPARLMAWVESTASSAGPRQSVPEAASTALTQNQSTPHLQNSGSPASQFSTALRVDQNHQPYYEVIDDSTGAVIFEIPPQALREIGESLNLHLEGDPSVPGVDVKS